MLVTKMKMVVGSISYADSLDDEPPMVHIEAYNGRNTLSVFMYEKQAKDMNLGDVIDLMVEVDHEG